MGIMGRTTRAWKVMAILAAGAFALGACGGASGGTGGGASTSASEVSAEASPTAASTVASTAPEPSESGTAIEEDTALMAYADLLNAYRDVVYDPEGHSETVGEDAEVGVRDAASLLGDDAMDSIGYAVTDISGDGIPELVIGEAGAADGEEGGGGHVYAVYTLAGGAPKFVFNGLYRNTYVYLGSGEFLNSGSGGASYSVYGTFRLTADGTALECEDFYFSAPLGDGTELGYYHNSTGQIDTDSSERLDVTADEFDQARSDLAARGRTLDMTPFSRYGAIVGDVHIQWADDADLPTNHDIYNVDGSSATSRIAFTALDEVSDFAVLSLSLVDVHEDGSMAFDAQQVLTPALAQGKPVEVRADLGETAPLLGFQFADADGGFHRVALTASGKDGSLVAQEAEPNSFDFILSGAVG